MTVWGMRVLASLAGTRSASSLPFHWNITNVSFHSKQDRRNPNLDQEHEFSWGICGSDNPLRVKASVEAPRPLVSFGSINQATVQLAQVKQGQTRSNMAKQGQTMSNKVTCFLRLLGGGGVQCCGLALVVSRPRFALKTKDIQNSLCGFRYWPFPSSSFQIHQWDRHSPSYPSAPKYYPESMFPVKLYELLSWSTGVLKISSCYHLVTKTSPLEQILSLAVPPHPLVNHLRRRSCNCGRIKSETFSTVNSSSMSPIMIPSKARTSETGEDWLFISANWHNWKVRDTIMPGLY